MLSEVKRAAHLEAEDYDNIGAEEAESSIECRDVAE
jgi:hypothetical protein